MRLKRLRDKQVIQTNINKTPLEQKQIVNKLLTKIDKLEEQLFIKENEVETLCTMYLDLKNSIKNIINATNKR